MSSLAEVSLWGRTIGAVLLGAGREVAAFEYDSAFAGSGVEVAPLMMPLSRRVYRFPELARRTFHGLPGLLSDSLPDKFGNAVIDAWLASLGRLPESFNAVERLCYTGKRGMGALEFAPTNGPKAKESSPVYINELVALASEVLARRNGLRVSFDDVSRSATMKEIVNIGTSAGGARAKAVIAWNPVTHEVRSGQVHAGDGFEYWLLKFDGVKGNQDKEIEDPQGYGAIEYAYAGMAIDAGLIMSPCRLLEENGRRHFMTRRFDRRTDGTRLHMQSLCAMAHYDFNLAGACSYEQALLVMRQLGMLMSDVEQFFRRMVFNIVARNQDDHVKNIAFLMDQSGAWSLAPAFDVTYSYNPSGDWTARHQMTLNGKRDGFVMDDFRAAAKAASLKRGAAERVVREVTAVVARWRDYADTVGIDPVWRDQIQSTVRLDLVSA